MFFLLYLTIYKYIMKANDLSYQQAYNFKAHQKKLKEIQKTPTKRLDNRLPDIFLNKRKKKGYDNLWRDYRVNKENQFLLNRLIEIKSKHGDGSKPDKKAENKEDESGIIDKSGSDERLKQKVNQGIGSKGSRSVPRRSNKLDPL